jgi:hypothetical protein
MKHILTAFIAVTLFSMSTTSAAPLPPEQFLETMSDVSYKSRMYLSNSLLVIGIPYAASSALIEGESTQTTVLSTGLFYTGMGVAMRFFPFEAEQYYARYKSNDNVSAISAVNELKDSLRVQRYVAAGIFAIPLLLDFSVGSNSTNAYPQDTNVIIKTLSASIAIGTLLFESPLEQMCQDVINGHESNVRVDFTPSLDKQTLAMTVKF